MDRRPGAIGILRRLAVYALGGDEVLAGGIVGVNHRAPGLIDKTGNTAAAVIDLQELPGGMRQSGELCARPGRRDAVAVGVFDKVHPAVAAEAGHQTVRFAEDEGAAGQPRQRGVVAGLGEVAAGEAGVRLETALVAVKPRDDRGAV